MVTLLINNDSFVNVFLYLKKYIDGLDIYKIHKTKRCNVISKNLESFHITSFNIQRNKITFFFVKLLNLILVNFTVEILNII